MADSYTIYTASGSQDTFNITFGYLDPDHVFVTVDNVPVAFTFPTGSQVQISSGNPTNGAKVRVYRVTPRDVRQVVWQNAANLTADDLNTADLQILYIVQEAFDNVEDALRKDTSGIYDALSLRIINLATPTQPTDAANKAYVDAATVDIVGDATAARDAAIAAQGAAEDARDDILNDAGFIIVAADLLGADTIGTVATNIAAVQNADANMAAIIDAPNQAAIATAGAARLNGTSTTSITLGTGSKSFTTQGGKDFAVGRHLLFTSNANPTTHWMTGTVTAYNTGTGAITITSESFAGSGSRADWTIRVDGVLGQTGAAGADGGVTLATTTYSTSSTLVLTDAGKNIAVSNASAINLTVPPNSSVAFPVGTQILVEQTRAGQVTFVAGAGVTINKNAYFSLKLKGQYSVAMLKKTATDVWTLAGHLELA